MDKPVVIVTQKDLICYIFKWFYMINLPNVHGLRFIENAKLITTN